METTRFAVFIVLVAAEFFGNYHARKIRDKQVEDRSLVLNGQLRTLYLITWLSVAGIIITERDSPFFMLIWVGILGMLVFTANTHRKRMAAILNTLP